jgi:hypothetical protein
MDPILFRIVFDLAAAAAIGSFVGTAIYHGVVAIVRRIVKKG